MKIKELIEMYVAEIAGMPGKQFGESHLYTLRRLQKDPLAEVEAEKLTPQDLIAFAKRRRRFAHRFGFGLGRPREVAPGQRDFREKARRFGRRPSGCEADVERGDRAFPVSGGNGGGETLGIVRGFGGRVGGREEGDDVADFRL